ncbi:30S ribosomal protein S17 [Rickettsiales endosymbiont of Stachyamoeba lipophora]|uniref:30S ribosomal protein S17 n=1 Tax=Rickettsiales endosymbiont of Stachyamoeba lipophora TaxID=2486578 RepID=UPI000F64FEA9|nr:30S ribosomal protein S17 [Rickettsiales endosymbiont of Stachyamoeba lipophora]AZL15873.1 30S ribosomal protein S17 [Rickettsiales endosymbiont of Stachyamoeba lipophora]
MPKRVLTGVVVSDKPNKTAVIKVTRRIKHPIYKKTVTVTKKYSVHDENNECHMGDFVTFEESSPISKTKKWKVTNIAKSEQ